MTGRRPRWPGADEPGRRLFIAVPLPPAANDAIADLVERIRGRGVPGGGRDVRWVRLDGLHITLRFLGPTIDDRIGRAHESLRGAAAGARPFDITLGGAGSFPDAGRPRTLWLDMTSGATPLTELAARTNAAVVTAGWPSDDRPFKAHLTLARSDGVPAGRAIADMLAEEAAETRIGAWIDRMGLFESVTGGGPARYVPLEMALFDGSST